MILIEFIGLPGAGKSFFSQKLISKILLFKKVKSEKYLKLSYIKKFFLLINFFFENTIFVLLLLLLHYKNKNLDKTWKNRHIYFLKNEFLKYQYYKSTDLILVNSEGFHYRTLFYLSGILKDESNKVARMLVHYTPKPDYLILIKINKKNSIKSTKKRKKGFKYDAQSIKGIQQNIKTLNFIKKSIYKYEKINFIIMDQKNSTKINLDILKNKILNKIK